MSAPVVLFTHARPTHTAKVLRALADAHGADVTDLIVYSDDARDAREAIAVTEVRELLAKAQGFRSVRLIERSENFGLQRNILQGVTAVCAEFGRAIVVEDDIVVSPWFLSYMNDALERYADEAAVASIGAYTPRSRDPLPETFFLGLPDCWGWGVWQRSWSGFRPDGLGLLSEVLAKGLHTRFDLEGAMPATEMLRRQVAGEVKSWNILWAAHLLLTGGLSLYPAAALTRNIGFDRTGVSASGRPRFAGAPLHLEPIRVEAIAIEENKTAREAWRRELRPRAALWRRVWRRLRTRAPVRFEGPFDSWSEAAGRAGGYDDAAILERVRDATLAVQAGAAPAERDGFLLEHPELSWHASGALLSTAARHGGRLRVMDIGGALGSSWFQNRIFFPLLAEVRWGIVEQPHFVACGQQDIHQPGLSFHASIAECAATVIPQVALLSGVLQMIEDPEALLRELSATAVDMIVLDRTPFSHRSVNLTCVQRVSEPIYEGSYPTWIFAEGAVQRILGPGWKQVSVFDSNDHQGYRCGGVRMQFRGMVFERVHDA